MTESYVQQVLTAAFLTLNTSSSKPYIKFDGEGKPVNIAMPNIQFIPPANKSFFVLSFLPGEPNPAGMGTEAYNRFDGVFQIDVYSPVGKGEDEVNAKYEALARLFERGKCFDEVIIQKIYCPLREPDEDLAVYRAVVRIEWTCDLPK
jgi:hypothetical protein